MSRLPATANVQLILGLGAAIFALLFASVIGAIAIGGGDDETVDPDNLSAGSQNALDDVSDPADLGTDSTITGETVPGEAPAPGTPGAPNTAPGTKTVAPAPLPPRPADSAKNPCIPSSGNSKTGVTNSELKFGLHAPVTFDGQPLNLAEDPLEGVDIFIRYINQHEGGVNGRIIKYKVEDDRYNTTGAQGAADRLMDYKPFMISGTLGVDQVAVVASEACKQKIPYMAAGGSESLFKDIGMFQIAASYDTHLIQLADYLAQETKRAGSPYFNKTKVGVTQLDSKYIDPAVDESFRNALARHKMDLVKVTKILKPTVQTDYNEEINDLKSAGAEIVVPAQDPISTGRMVAECRTKQCGWVWSFSNFAHESDTALQLMGGAWNGVRGLAGGCYYLAPTAYDPSKCGAMKTAHEQWVKMNGEDDWRKDGSGGAAGYQIVHFWLKALRDLGSDVSREGFVARLLTYDNYNDLVSGPISFRSSKNLSHGAEWMVPLQAGVDKYTQLTPGFVDKF